MAVISPVHSEPREVHIKKVYTCWNSFKLATALGYQHQNKLEITTKAEYISPIYSQMIKLKNQYCLRRLVWSSIVIVFS